MVRQDRNAALYQGGRPGTDAHADDDGRDRQDQRDGQEYQRLRHILRGGGAHGKDVQQDLEDGDDRGERLCRVLRVGGDTRQHPVGRFLLEVRQRQPHDLPPELFAHAGHDRHQGDVRQDAGEDEDILDKAGSQILPQGAEIGQGACKDRHVVLILGQDHDRIEDREERAEDQQQPGLFDIAVTQLLIFRNVLLSQVGVLS